MEDAVSVMGVERIVKVNPVPNLLWAVFVLPLGMIAVALYVVFAFIVESVFGNNEDMRDPCERFSSYEKMLEANKNRI